MTRRGVAVRVIFGSLPSRAVDPAGASTKRGPQAALAETCAWRRKFDERMATCPKGR
jgi:hypothetical protein